MKCWNMDYVIQPARDHFLRGFLLRGIPFLLAKGCAWSVMVHGCMVYTEHAPRRQQFYVAPAMPALKYTTSMDKKKKKKRAIQS